ncbi:MAG: DUF1801 domain-containing protein [Candidatus Levybacteria bacterium]|nr:DUF1801 domain-containing protein [Candidatus Levybacteria bacterium]
MKKATSVDEYISTAPKDIQEKLQQIRQLIKEVAPDAIEKISYGMPYYGYKGRLVYFAYAKNHIGLYAMPSYLEGYASEIQKYRTGKATLSFPLDKELPLKLIRELIKEGVKHNEKKK